MLPVSLSQPGRQWSDFGCSLQLSRMARVNLILEAIVQTGPGTKRGLSIVCPHVRQSRELYGGSYVSRLLSTSKIFGQLAIDHGEKQPLTARSGRLLENLVSMNETGAIDPRR